MPTYDDTAAGNQEPVTITIRTRTPEKWRFVDLVAGDIWMYSSDHFKLAHDIAVCLSDAGTGSRSPEEDPRWPLFMTWVESTKRSYSERDLALWWEGYSAGHLDRTPVRLVSIKPLEQYGPSPLVDCADAYIRTVQAISPSLSPFPSLEIPLDLSAKMAELITLLRTTGFLDLRWPEISPQCQDQWNKGYATCKNAYADDSELGEYFNSHDYQDRFRAFLDEFFKSGPGNTMVEVVYRRSCQEIEVMIKSK